MKRQYVTPRSKVLKFGTLEELMNGLVISGTTGDRKIEPGTNDAKSNPYSLWEDESDDENGDNNDVNNNGN